MTAIPTIQVRRLANAGDGDPVIINEHDFDPTLHERVEEPAALDETPPVDTAAADKPKPRRGRPPGAGKGKKPEPPADDAPKLTVPGSDTVQ